MLRVAGQVTESCGDWGRIVAVVAVVVVQYLHYPFVVSVEVAVRRRGQRH